MTICTQKRIFAHYSQPAVPDRFRPIGTKGKIKGAGADCIRKNKIENEGRKIARIEKNKKGIHIY